MKLKAKTKSTVSLILPTALVLSSPSPSLYWPHLYLLLPLQHPGLLLKTALPGVQW